RAKDIVSLFESRPDLRSRVSIQLTDWPTMSELLFAFYGFIDRRFREFDFYLGMYHGHRHALDKAVPFLHARGYGEVRFPEDAARRGTPEERAGWAPYECIRAVLDGDDASICRDPALVDFRTLLQVSLYRLYDHCRALGEKPVPPETDHRRCKEAMDGAEPPVVPGMEPLPADQWRSRK